MFVCRDLKEDRKLRREKWRESSFSKCLIGRGREKMVVDLDVFSSPRMGLGGGGGGEAQRIEPMKMPMEG